MGRLFFGYFLLAKQKKVTSCRATPGDFEPEKQIPLNPPFSKGEATTPRPQGEAEESPPQGAVIAFLPLKKKGRIEVGVRTNDVCARCVHSPKNWTLVQYLR